MARKARARRNGIAAQAGDGSVLLDSHKARQLGSWLLIRKDLNFVGEATSQLLKLRRIDPEDLARLGPLGVETLRKSLWFALVITYGKLFTSAEGRCAQLDPSTVLLPEIASRL